MAPEYTEEKLENMDKETIIQLFLSQQNQLRNIDKNLQLVLEQLADSKRQRFGRSSEKHEVENQISFMEVDGKVVFFNEAEAVAGESAGSTGSDEIPRKKNTEEKGKTGAGFRRASSCGC